MNKVLSFLVISLVLVSCSGNKDKDVVRSYWDNGKLKSELRYKDGKYVSDGTLWVRFMAYVNEYYNMFNLDRS